MKANTFQKSYLIKSISVTQKSLAETPPYPSSPVSYTAGATRRSSPSAKRPFRPAIKQKEDGKQDEFGI